MYFLFKSSKSIDEVSLSTSTKTGTKSLYKTAVAVEAKVIAGTSTFFPFGNLYAIKAKCKAAVAEAWNTRAQINPEIQPLIEALGKIRSGKEDDDQLVAINALKQYNGSE